MMFNLIQFASSVSKSKRANYSFASNASEFFFTNEIQPKKKKRKKKKNKMSWRGWSILLLIYVLYLLIGGFSFRALEYPDDCNEKKEKVQQQRSVRDSVIDFVDQLSYEEESDFLSLLQSIDPSLVTADFDDWTTDAPPSLRVDNSTISDEECAKWNLYNSVFFSFTAVTTIGYGHIYPATDGGKLLCIFYSLLGVPINGILIGTLGSFFGGWLKRFVGDKSHVSSDAVRYLLILRDLVMFLVPGAIIFLVGPSFAFWALEDEWTYLDSFYYAFITLTTIGFGDYVAGRDLSVLERLGGWKEVYQICLIIWIIFGLGYIVMLITIIADGLQKPARSAARKFKAARGKVAVNRIMEEIVKSKARKGSSPIPASELSSRTCSVSCLPDTLDGISESSLRMARSAETAAIKDLEEKIEGLNQTIATDESNILDEPPSEAAPANQSLSHEDIHNMVVSLKNFLDASEEYNQQLKEEPLEEEQQQQPERRPRKGVSMMNPVDLVTRQLQKAGPRSRTSSSSLRPLPASFNWELLKTTTVAEFLQIIEKVEREELKEAAAASTEVETEQSSKLTRKKSLLHLPASLLGKGSSLTPRSRSQSTGAPPSGGNIFNDVRSSTAPSSESGETDRVRL